MKEHDKARLADWLMNEHRHTLEMQEQLDATPFSEPTITILRADLVRMICTQSMLTGMAIGFASDADDTHFAQAREAVERFERNQGGVC